MDVSTDGVGPGTSEYEGAIGHQGRQILLHLLNGPGHASVSVEHVKQGTQFGFQGTPLLSGRIVCSRLGYEIRLGQVLDASEPNAGRLRSVEKPTGDLQEGSIG
jgi:hypothetical protein